MVYDLVAKIPPGRVMTYGQIGKCLGGVYSGRTVGFAMRAAPAGRGLPCHRVVNIKGEMAPSYAFGSQHRQRAMLQKEGVAFRPDGRIDLAVSLWHPDTDNDRKRPRTTPGRTAGKKASGRSNS